MSKVIYLYNQDNLSSKDKLYNIILNFLKSINTNLIINLFNYFFNDSINTKDVIRINMKDINNDRNKYIPLDSLLPSINFIINDKLLYSIEILSSIKNNFSIYLLKYNINEDSQDSYTVNLPEVKLLEFENTYPSQEKYNYTIKIYNHSLSYEIPVFKVFEYDFKFLKDNNLCILLPFSLFSIYNKIINTSKISSHPSDLKKEILNLSKNTYKNIKNLNLCDNYLDRNDYIIIKDTIGEIIDYYLDSLI